MTVGNQYHWSVYSNYILVLRRLDCLVHSHISNISHKLHLNAGSFGTAKPFEPNDLLMKRVCEGSKYCPGTDKTQNGEHSACENAPNNSYALKGDRHRSHVSKNMWTHEALIDVMVHYSKHSDVVSEYMKAFRHAVLLRHMNLFH